MEGIPARKLWGTNHGLVAPPQAGGDAKLIRRTHVLKHQDLFGDIDIALPDAR